MSRIYVDRSCAWCGKSAPYSDGTGCRHDPPVSCPRHSNATDLNLVARGRHAVVKCTHYGNTWVALLAAPIDDDKSYGTYVVQFAMPGVGQERYTVAPHKGVCPHKVYDYFVQLMQGGERPDAKHTENREMQLYGPGKKLENDA